MNRLVVILIAAAVTLAACQTPATDGADSPEPSAAAFDETAARAEIQGMSDAYEAAARAGDEAAIQAMHTGEAVLHPANEPAARGRAAVDSLLMRDNGEPVEMTLTTTEIVFSSSGDLAYEVGTVESPAGPGKYLTVYRMTDAGWRIVADTWSPDAPPADAADGG
jgi:ketosteroid isomerase-like protein